MKIAVIGAGIAGLTCAYELKKRGAIVTVYEKNPFVGGRMASRDANGFLFDTGANFFLNNYKKIPHYLSEFGLEEAWQPLPPKRFDTFKGGKLYPLYSELFNMLFRMQQISFPSRVRLATMMLREVFRKEPLNFYNLSESAACDIETAYNFVLSRAGQEVTDYIAEPFASTFQFHSCRDLSMAAALSLLWELMQRNKEFTLYHTVGGMRTLPEAFAKRLDVRLNTPTQSVVSAQGKVLLNQTDTFDVAVLACTAPAALKLYENPTPLQKELLESIEYAPTINVSFKVPTPLTKEITYVMVPFVEGGQVAEYSNESLKGEHTQCNGHTLINVGLHEGYAKALLEKSDSEILTEVKQAFLAVCPPLASHAQQVHPHTLQRWTEALPKYKLGSITKVKEFMERGQGEQNIYFCGDYLNSPWTEGSCLCGERVARQIQARLQA